MMISYQSLLKEIEQHVTKFKSVKDEQQLREELSAIRALCNVMLSNGSGNQGQGQGQGQGQTQGQSQGQMSNGSGTLWAQQNPVNQGSNEASSLMGQQAQSQNSIMDNSSLSNEKLNDKEGNGSSIFDF